MNSLVPSYCLVKYSIKPVDLRVMSLVSALLNRSHMSHTVAGVGDVYILEMARHSI